MNIYKFDKLICTDITINFRDKEKFLKNVVIDTGAAQSIINSNEIINRIIKVINSSSLLYSILYLDYYVLTFPFFYHNLPELSSKVIQHRLLLYWRELLLKKILPP